ncbi:hypothetical protein C0992_006590 [Termitomyces sp. T32_za158]|nr:hypothetical protein C0992_006590 [Termitomyces sp. T32_za158]
MATFAKKAFSASIYSTFRPTYPKRLFQEVYEYHNAIGSGSWNVAVDLGCGTGQATYQLKDNFSSVIGVDPSQSMIDAAREKHRELGINFCQGKSEDLRSTVPDNSTYGEMRLPEYPSTTPLITAYAQGKDLLTSLGPYFERPGRTILENMLTDVPDPTLLEGVVKVRGGLSHFERRYYAGTYYPTHLPPPSPTQVKPVEMQMIMRWRDVLGYLKTWSSLQNFHEHFPNDLRRVDERFPEDKADNQTSLRTDVDVSGGDIAVRFWKDLREEAKKSGGKYGVDELVSVEWPIALLLAKKV